MTKHRFVEKGEEFQNHSTRAELAKTLGVSVNTIIRYQQSGKIPEPVAQTKHGWWVWSPEQVTAIIQRKANPRARTN